MNKNYKGNKDERDQQYGKGSRKPNSRKPRKEAVKKDDVPELVPTTGSNDINWYFDDKEIAEQASQLSFQSFIGSGTILDSVKAPSILAIHMNPSPGITIDVQNGTPFRSGLNMAMTKIYSKLAMNTGRAMTYQPQDVAMGILAINEVISMFEHARRAFGIVMNWNERNRTIPKEAIRALGFDADDLFANLADYRMRFNTLVAQFNEVPIVETRYLRKCLWIYQNIFKDSESEMAQMYILVPSTTWLLDETSYSGGTILSTKAAINVNAVRTMGDFLNNVIATQINALLSSSTLNLVYADIFNLAAKDSSLQMLKMDYLTEDYHIESVYDKITLYQIHNMNCIGVPDYTAYSTSPVVTPNNDVYSDAGWNEIIYNPAFSNAVKKARHEQLIDLCTTTPTVEDRIEASRMKIVPSLGTAEVITGYNAATTIPDHYPVLFAIYSNDGVTADIFTTTSDIPSSFVSSVLQITQFDMAPTLYVRDTAVAESPVTALVSEIDTFTTVDHKYLKRLNNLIYMAMFNPFTLGSKK